MVLTPILYVVLFAVLRVVGPLPSDSLRGSGFVLALPMIIAIYVAMNFCTLFAVTSVGVTTRLAVAKWSHVRAIVYTRAGAPGSVEVGVVATPDADLWSKPMPVRAGEVLTDLPMRVRIPDSKFSADRLAFTIARFAGPGTELVEQIDSGFGARHVCVFGNPAGGLRNN